MSGIQSFFGKGENRILFFVSLSGFILLMIVNIFFAYGIFRDEFYYLACANHLSWGYVDQPPLSILFLKISTFFFGNSMIGMRVLPALCASAVIFITGIITIELNGGKTAIILSTLAVLFTPVYLSIFDFYSMNSFDILFWALLFLIIVKIIKTDNQKLWILFGVILGLGFQNKLSVLFLCFGIFIGILFTSYRRIYKSKYLWIGFAITFLIYIPHIIWQIQNDFPTLEFIRNASQFKNAQSSFGDFLKGQLLDMGPENAIIWIAGLLLFLFKKDFKMFRVFSIAYILIFMVFVLQNGKAYYLSPFYPILFAGGGVAIEIFISKRNFLWIKPTLVSTIIIGGFVAMPLAIPILPPETFIKYSKAIGIEPGGEERDAPSKLGQHFADMFGWENVAYVVSQAYNKLSPDEKKSCSIYAQNYGQAGAIDYYRKKYGLPNVYSPHNSYWYWGPGSDNVKVMIIIGGNEEDYKKSFEHYEISGYIKNQYSRSFENNLPVYICRGKKFSIIKLWPKLKSII